MRVFATRFGMVVLVGPVLFGWRGNAAHAQHPAPTPHSLGVYFPIHATAAPTMRFPIGVRSPEHANPYSRMANGMTLGRLAPNTTLPQLPATLPATGYGPLWSFGPSVLLAATPYGGTSWYVDPGGYGGAYVNPLGTYQKGAGNAILANLLYGKTVPAAGVGREPSYPGGLEHHRERATTPERVHPSPPLAEILSARAGAGLIKNKGELQWPKPLTGQEFKDGRERMDRLVKDAVPLAESGNPVAAANVEDMRTELAGLNATLSRNIGTLSPADYLAARHYLDLLADTVLALEDPGR